MADCLVALGGNVGDRRETLSRAVALLNASRHIDVAAQSAWHETPAIGGPPDQRLYLNGAVRLTTALSPEAVLVELQQIENQLGRVREQHWGPRTIDLDLLLYDELVLSSQQLTVPHPRMAFRRFVLEAAAEVAPDMRHPQIGWTIHQLRDHLRSAVPYVAITGVDNRGNTQLALELVDRCRGELVLSPSGDLSRNTRALMHGEMPFRPLEHQIELLDRLCQWLRTRVTPDRRKLAVSSFWLEERLAGPMTSLDAAQASQLQKYWEEARARVVSPKLLVVLDPPVVAIELPERLRSSMPRIAVRETNKLAANRQALLNRALRPGVGPVLHLTSGDAAANVAEAAAAIESMQ